ncbi:MAG: DUF2087 domain-containing protein [Actinobacteria bacterium]|nr:MAG: DUF2087 domain-containing protein [Actinomycetota bacterium]
MLERRRFARDLGGEGALAPAEIVQLLLAEPEPVRQVEAPGRSLDPIAEPLREVRREHRALPGADQLLEGPTLRVRQLHASMLRGSTDMAETPDEILRALADPQRLAIAGILARGPASARTLAEALDLPVERVRTHLNRLASAGVARVSQDRASYWLDRDTLRWAAEQVGPPRETGLVLGAVTPTERSVLRTFFRNGRLTEIPTKRSKRRMVLERIAIEFEPGRRYDEKEVNGIVARFFNDHAALRRALVDEGLLGRDHGEYWRAGGPGDAR